MEKFKLLLALVVMVVSTLIAVAKFLLIETHDFWLYVKDVQW